MRIIKSSFLRMDFNFSEENKNTEKTKTFLNKNS